MKSKLIIGFLIGLMLVGIAAAFPTPLPVNGRLTGDNVGGQLIIVTNLATGDIQRFITSSSGEYLVDWINTPNYYSRDDVFEIKIAICAEVSTACVKTITYTGTENRLYVDFDLGQTITCPACPISNSGGSCSGGGSYGILYKCTQEEAEKLVDCPTDNNGQCPIDTTPFESCSSCCAVEVCEICKPSEPCEVCEAPGQDEQMEWIVYILVAVLGIGGGTLAGIFATKNKITPRKGVAYRVRYSWKGVLIEEHKHPGIRSYHKIGVEHQVEHERHKKDERIPNYQKDVDGVYKYVGD